MSDLDQDIAEFAEVVVDLYAVTRTPPRPMSEERRKDLERRIREALGREG